MSRKGWPWTTRNLGGGTLFYGGASFRYTPFDFDPSTIQEFCDLPVAWPKIVGDLDLEYGVLEKQLGVSGGDPASPGANTRLPPHSFSEPAQILKSCSESKGYRPFPTPLAIRLRDQSGVQKCIRESLCITEQCRFGGKSDVVSVFLRPIVDMPHVLLLTAVKAVKLTQSKSKSISGLAVLDLTSGNTGVIRAKNFVICGNAIQSAALLLRSDTTSSPNGVGNENDLVGRGLTMKMSAYVSGSRRDIPRPPTYNGPFSTISFTDHYMDSSCPGGVGGLIYEAKADNDEFYESSGLKIRLETIISDLPSLTNRIQLSSERNKFGLKNISIDYTPSKIDKIRLSIMINHTRELLRESGCSDIITEPSDFHRGSTHLHGTCRMGTSPNNSVVDPYCRVHSAENLYVIDGSVFPYPGGLNPTLTIQANALRCASHLLSLA
ncbi:GMC family oxidoreductase [Rhizobium sp. VS19-DR104.2]|uniref:GMC oxidoreductase n=1 Tax=unclassified Rhizobium TaxID=2613769 RepID=UPI001CC3DB9F|nr:MULTISPECIES: GMC family oxidoreductase [unclassified Rhizobium]MBZ5762314.1 GMC family oxidoreductase [Rhizobium sp. VS19-DR96]MBZ5768330.1 GMC family oxidoreductase [Rhizobium sp. VS19-DR129.2]MBZ5775798.1 GMC family oxidoreductase [Rhizobium sp. VS19-DRK62.2]MBZ5787181.1 GMC family oxidoreductase [Rhizobium sp. VS19-DR121]MBZ5804256.1 GMC family oxidoreductase [Rhizobium sp. VS19-DR181]